MLFILYGTTSSVGYATMDFFEGKGINIVEKYTYAPATPQLNTTNKARVFISREEFLEKTDSLFRYELGGIYYGFNQNDISDAVCDKKDSLLLIAASNLDFVSEIKRVYEEHVCIIYAHIDDITLEEIIRNRPNIKEDEVNVRLSIGKGVKSNYASHASLFDKVVIYSGENSFFNCENLCKQYEAIINSVKPQIKAEELHDDVFISYAREDKAICQMLVSELQNNGISVCYNANVTLAGEWKAQIKNLVQHAKVVILIVTKNSLKSLAVKEELIWAMSAASSNGTMVIPFVSDDETNTGFQMIDSLPRLSGVTFNMSDIEAKANELINKIQTLFSWGEKLKSLSVKIEDYIQLKMFAKAIELQKEHSMLCDKAYARSNGQYIGIDACIMSRSKLARLFIECKQYEDALDFIFGALNMCIQAENSELFDELSECFAVCCLNCGYNLQEAKRLAKKALDYEMSIEGENVVDALISPFNCMLQDCKINKNVSKNERDEVKAGQIALHGENVMRMFDELLTADNENTAAAELVLGYERLLNYCKHIGLQGDIPEMCIKRIAEIKENTCGKGGQGGGEYNEALRLYLGETQNKPGEYDVFISYKSQDEALAQKIYDYLTQAGMEVFFSKESLPKLGQSEYEEMIFAALEKAKHMVLVASNPDYLKTPWVKEEWDTFNNEIREGRKDGNLLLVLTDDIAYEKGRLPLQLRQKEIIKMSEHKKRLTSYLK